MMKNFHKIDYLCLAHNVWQFVSMRFENLKILFFNSGLRSEERERERESREMESETRYSLLEMAHESSVSAEEAFRIGDFENARRHYEIASEKFGVESVRSISHLFSKMDILIKCMNIVVLYVTLTFLQ